MSLEYAELLKQHFPDNPEFLGNKIPREQVRTKIRNLNMASQSSFFSDEFSRYIHRVKSTFDDAEEEDGDVNLIDCDRVGSMLAIMNTVSFRQPLSADEIQDIVNYIARACNSEVDLKAKIVTVEEAGKRYQSVYGAWENGDQTNPLFQASADLFFNLQEHKLYDYIRKLNDTPWLGPNTALPELYSTQLDHSGIDPFWVFVNLPGWTLQWEAINDLMQEKGYRNGSPFSYVEQLYRPELVPIIWDQGTNEFIIADLSSKH